MEVWYLIAITVLTFVTFMLSVLAVYWEWSRRRNKSKWILYSFIKLSYLSSEINIKNNKIDADDCFISLYWDWKSLKEKMIIEGKNNPKHAEKIFWLLNEEMRNFLDKWYFWKDKEGKRKRYIEENKKRKKEFFDDLEKLREEVDNQFKNTKHFKKKAK